MTCTRVNVVICRRITAPWESETWGWWRRRLWRRWSYHAHVFSKADSVRNRYVYTQCFYRFYYWCMFINYNYIIHGGAFFSCPFRLVIFVYSGVDVYPVYLRILSNIYTCYIPTSNISYLSHIIDTLSSINILLQCCIIKYIITKTVRHVYIIIQKP